MAKLSDLNRMKEEAETARNTMSKATGALEQTMSQIKTEFGCKTIEEAQAKLKKMTMEVGEAEASFEKALEVYREEWGL